MARWRRLLASAAMVAVAAVPFGAAAPASADEPTGLEFSRNNSTWTATPPVSILPSAVRVVPGDTLNGWVYIRNARSVPSVISVIVANPAWSEPTAGSTFTLRGADGSGHGLAATTLAALPPCAQLVPTRVLNPGQSVLVSTALTFPGSVTTLQGSWIQFEVQVGISDLVAPTSPNGCPISRLEIPGLPDPEPQTDPGGGSSGGSTGGSGGTGGNSTPTGSGEIPRGGAGAMPYTGVRGLVPTLIVAVIAAGLGGIFMTIARRRRREDEPETAELDEHVPESLRS